MINLLLASYYASSCPFPLTIDKPLLSCLVPIVFLRHKNPKLEDIFLVKNRTGERFKLWEMIVAKWFDIGTKLGLENDLLESIQEDPGRGESKLRRVLGKWFDNAGNLPHNDEYPLTWKGLRTLLEDIDKEEVARKFFAFLD